ncbi:PKD domain-containing protein [Lutibacter sp.]|uniref:PKD domain-containing protein n=1 Tax=Lutibacter sp. TaxID=1925666 RepID=UPI0025BF1414|nr:PKD domain-containing protein [Lutibacter sp.]MCF6180630.1 PKD domain-containing protein [Lutibacter sp.]
MRTKIKTIALIFAVILLGFTSCKEDNYSLGDLSAPTDLTITADIAGKTDVLPNGDGSGIVNFTFNAKNAISYKVDFGDGSAPKVYPATKSKKYGKVGTKHYRVMVTAIGKGGSTTSLIKEIDVYYAFNVDPAIVTMLTGDSATGKTWMIDSDLNGNLGLGPGPDRPDGNAETFDATWFKVGPNGKAGKGIYDDRYTFTNTKVYTHVTNGDLYGYKWAFARDFDPATPGVFGGYGSEWILDYPDYTEGFDFDGEKGSDGVDRTIITFEKLGYCGFFNGSHRMMIIEITDTTMYLRATSDPGTNDATWYVRLKVVAP